jgi:hypothetical protein
MTLPLLAALAVLLLIFWVCMTAVVAWVERNSLTIGRVLRLLLVVAVIVLSVYLIALYQSQKGG